MTAATEGRNIDTKNVVSSEAGTVTVQATPDLRIIYSDRSDLTVDLTDLTVDSATGSVSRLDAVGFKAGDMAKRVFDIGVATTALVASLPVWVVVSLIAGLGEGGPILYSQQRIGRGGKMFRCWKFRTMRVDADRFLADILNSDSELARQWEADHKLDDDPRITRLGHVLRRFDLDEIPQFLNVLNGDMSVVGPRPVTLDEAPKFGRVLPTVLSVRPGLTGSWQVSGRNSMTYDERVQQEASYVASRSFLGDLAICLRTPMALLRRNGGR